VSKTVKHCDVCNENFGDRFSFCPVCGETLKAVGVGEPEAFTAPVVGSNAAVSEQREEKIAATASTASLAGEGAPFVHSEPRSANGSANFKANGVTENASSDNVFTHSAPPPDSDAPVNFEIDGMPYHADGLYHLTILQSGKERRLNLMNGAMAGLILLITIGTGYWVWELFRYPLDISAIDQDLGISYAYLNTEDPLAEEEQPVRKDDEKGGGGGGGGKKDPDVQKGIMPQMRREKQEIAPDVERVVKNFELKQQATLEGPPQPVNKSIEQYGVINSTKTVGGGTGEGRGLGNGRGSGIGTGNGTGYGTGTGSGIGGGNGNGIGNGIGDGLGEPPKVAERKPPAPAVTTPLQIISKPIPKFTEEARKQNVKGTVVLRITFSSNGQISNVSVIKGLPAGLTEQAIAAARSIQFKPMMKNGQAVSVIRPVEFSFNMY
jgi:TonB family protein